VSARLFGRYGATKGIDLRIEDKATIGRDPANEVCVNASEVSKDHATLLYDRDRRGYLLTDLGSRNGTQLDGAPLRGPELLIGLHVITLADSIDLIFHGGAPEPPPASEPRPAPARVESEAIDPQRFALVIQTPGDDQGTYLLVEGENGVGRGAELSVKLRSGEVSRNHAVITVRDGSVMLRDNNSANGTFLDDVAVSSDARVEEGMVLRFGRVAAILRRIAEP
jgi:pSer/pThr/pTyr-binding forkhead associated (FHA) protein